MAVDLRTLFVVHALVSIALAVLMALFWRTHRRLPGLGEWTLGTVLVGLVTFGGGLRGILPDILSITVANGFGLTSFVAYWNGIRSFEGKATRWKGSLLAVAAVQVFLAYHTYLVEDIQTRIVAASSFGSAVCFLCVHDLLRAAAGRHRSTAMTAAVLFALVGLTLAFRAASTALMPPIPDLFSATTAQAVHFLVSLISNILVVVALLMMAMQSLQQQIEARTIEVEAARARAEQASRSKSIFLAHMGHELRTPLTGVLGFADLIRTEAAGPIGNPQYREFATNIHDSGKHLLELLNEVLDHAQVEAGVLTLEEGKVDLAAAAAFCTGLLAPRAAETQIEIATSVVSAARFIQADEKRLRQILLNLVSNAVKYTPAGGRVTVMADIDPRGCLRLTVEDNGVGIDEADLERVLQPFERAQRGSAQPEGLGLGLPLTKRLVELHGGTLRLESASGQGTRVIVQLPAARVLAGPAHVHS